MSQLKWGKPLSYFQGATKELNSDNLRSPYFITRALTRQYLLLICYLFPSAGVVYHFCSLHSLNKKFKKCNLRFKTRYTEFKVYSLDSVTFYSYLLVNKSYIHYIWFPKSRLFFSLFRNAKGGYLLKNCTLNFALLYIMHNDLSFSLQCNKIQCNAIQILFCPLPLEAFQR